MGQAAELMTRQNDLDVSVLTRGHRLTVQPAKSHCLRRGDLTPVLALTLVVIEMKLRRGLMLEEGGKLDELLCAFVRREVHGPLK